MGAITREIVVKVSIDSEMSAAIQGLKDTTAQAVALATSYQQLLEQTQNYAQTITAQTAGSAQRTKGGNRNATTDYNTSLRNATASAEQFAKGLALVIAAQDESDRNFARAVINAEQYFNVMRSGYETLNSLKTAMKSLGELQTVASAATSAKQGSAAPSTIQSAAIVPSVGSAASLGPTMASLVNPITMLAAAALAAGVALRQLTIWEREQKEQQLASNARFAGIQSEAAHASVGRYASQAIRKSNAVPNYAAFGNPVEFQRRRSETEDRIQAEQAKSPRDYEAKQDIRRRAEQDEDFHERSTVAQQNYQHADEKLKSLAGSKEALLAKKKESEERYKIERTAIEAKRKDTTKHGDTVGINEQSYMEVGLNVATLGGYDYLGGNKRGSVLRHAITGEQTTDQARSENAKVDTQLAERDASRKAEEKQELEEIVRLEQQQLELGKQKVESGAQYLQTLREQAKADRMNYEHEKQKKDSAHEALGAMTSGQLMNLRRIQARIKAGQPLSHADRVTAANSPEGTLLHQEGKKLNRELGQKSGLEMVTIDEELKTKSDKSHSELKQKEPKVLEDLGKQAEANKAAQSEIIETIREAFNLEDVAAQLKEIGQKQRSLMEDALVTLSRWFK